MVAEAEKTGAMEPIADPLAKTMPLGFVLAAASTLVAWAVIFGLGWTPSPVATDVVTRSKVPIPRP